MPTPLRSSPTCASRGSSGTRHGFGRRLRSCRRRWGGWASSRTSPRFLFEDVEPDPALLDAAILSRAADELEPLEPWDAASLEAALKLLCEHLDAKPKTVYLPIRVAVTGSRISPGLYESLELLGRDVSLARLRRGAALAAVDRRPFS